MRLTSSERVRLTSSERVRLTSSERVRLTLDFSGFYSSAKHPLKPKLRLEMKSIQDAGLKF